MLKTRTCQLRCLRRVESTQKTTKKNILGKNVKNTSLSGGFIFNGSTAAGTAGGPRGPTGGPRGRAGGLSMSLLCARPEIVELSLTLTVRFRVANR